MNSNNINNNFKSLAIDHIGINVPNVEEAGKWFVKVFDAEILYIRGPYSGQDDWMKVNLDVHAKSIIRKLMLLKFDQGTKIELLEYVSPEQKQPHANNADWNAHHIAFRVNDIIAIKNNLEKKGIKFYGDTKVVEDNIGPNLEWIYFRAPWGLQLELIRYF